MNFHYLCRKPIESDMIAAIKSRISHRLIRVCALALAICVVNFCISKKCIACDNCDTSNLFKIEKISKKNDWFFIYASNNDKLYRILSQAPQRTDSLEKYDIIEKGKTYCLNLHSFTESVPRSEPTMSSLSMIWIGTLILDKKTRIEFNEDNDCFFTDNLRGLYYLPNDTSINRDYKLNL